MFRGHQKRAEVYEFAPIIFLSTLLVAFLVQGLLPVRFPFGRIFDLPLLLLIYFAANKSSKVYGILLGVVLGILQDALSHGYIGLFGMAKAVVGYAAAAVAVTINLDQLLPRFVLTGALVLLHRVVLLTLELTLFQGPSAIVPLDFFNTILVNTALSIVLFPILDRLRRRVW